MPDHQVTGTDIKIYLFERKNKNKWKNKATTSSSVFEIDHCWRKHNRIYVGIVFVLVFMSLKICGFPHCLFGSSKIFFDCQNHPSFPVVLISGQRSKCLPSWWMVCGPRGQGNGGGSEEGFSKTGFTADSVVVCCLCASSHSLFCLWPEDKAEQAHQSSCVFIGTPLCYYKMN